MLGEAQQPLGEAQQPLGEAQQSENFQGLCIVDHRP